MMMVFVYREHEDLPHVDQIESLYKDVWRSETLMQTTSDLTSVSVPFESILISGSVSQVVREQLTRSAVMSLPVVGASRAGEQEQDW